MDSLTYALGLRGALRWLGEAGRGSGVGPSTAGQAALGAQGEGMTYVIAVGPVCPDPPRWAQTMESRAQACPVGTHSTTREGFPGRMLMERPAWSSPGKGKGRNNPREVVRVLSESTMRLGLQLWGLIFSPKLSAF